MAVAWHLVKASRYDILVYMESLTERKQDILLAIVREYINSAKPVSSMQLTKSYSFNLSSATLRSTMAGLEEEGFLTHPHTSAGRIPTVLGYRYYVNKVSRRLSLGLEQRKYIIDFFSKQRQVEELLKQTTKFIAQYTPYLGIVIRYSHRKLSLKHLDIVHLGGSQLLLVAITTAGDVFKEKVFINRYDFEVSKLEAVLNRELAGLDLAQLEEKCRHIKALQLFSSIFDDIAEVLIKIFTKQQTYFYYDGVANLLNFPEFSELNQFSDMLSFLEGGDWVLDEISANLDANHTYVAIGDEVKSLSLNNVSLVIAPYGKNEQIAGAVGIVGPMRMDYEKAIATTECIAGNLSLFYGQG